MSQNNDDIHPDLLDAVDSLLEEIDETAQSFIPEEDRGLDHNALVTDEGEIITPSVAQAETQSGSDEPEAQADDGAVAEAADELDQKSEAQIDSIENAQQALDALDDVELQAEDLAEQSIDALLSDIEIDEDPEVASSETIDSESEPAPDAEAEPADEAVDPVDEQDLLDSIDELLDAADRTDAEADTEPESTTDAELTDIPQGVAGVDDEDAPETQQDPIDTAELEPDPIPEPAAELVAEHVAEPESEGSAVAESISIDASLDSETDSDMDPMDMLDSALSEAADDMLEGDFETEEGELVSGEAVASAIEEALEAQPKPGEDEAEDDIEALLGDIGEEILAADDTASSEPPTSDTEAEGGSSDTIAESPTESAPAVSAPSETAEPVAETPAAPIPEPASEPQPQAAPAPESEPAAAIQDPEVLREIDALADSEKPEPIPVPAWFVRTVEISRPKIDRIDPLKGKTMDALAAAFGGLIVVVMTNATPLAASVMILLSKPLSKYSPELRNAIGFIALWTGFLAVVLWAYLLMFRAPHVPTPETAPTRVINADESLVVQPVIEQLP